MTKHTRKGNKSKHIFIWIIALLVFVCACSIMRSEKVLATEKGVYKGFTYQYSKTYKGIKLVKYSGKSKKVKIPKKIAGKPVTAIGKNCFHDNGRITQVEMPDTIVVIGKHAFSECINLKKVKFSKNLKEIGADAFSECFKLKEFKFPSKLKKLGARSFLGTKPEKIHIPASVESIGKGAFSGCKVKKITFSKNSKVKRLDGTFKWCKNLKEITLPKSITGIKAGTFAGSGLKKIHFESNAKITIFEDNLFSDCAYLEEIDVPENITYIGADLFSYGELFEIETFDEKNKEVSHNVNRINFYGGKVKTIEKDAFCHIDEKTVFFLSKQYLDGYTEFLKKQPWYKSSMSIQWL